MADLIDKALAVHMLWKGRLRDAIDSGDLPDEATTRADDACELGQWMHGEGVKYRSLPEFSSVVACHAKFHEAAGDVVRLIKAGKKQEAEAELSSGAFAQATFACMDAVTKLQKVKGSIM